MDVLWREEIIFGKRIVGRESSFASFIILYTQYIEWLVCKNRAFLRESESQTCEYCRNRRVREAREEQSTFRGDEVFKNKVELRECRRSHIIARLGLIY